MGQINDGAQCKRVGLKPEGRAPARAGTEIQDTAGSPAGTVTSGGFGPSVDGPIAMGYVRTDLAKEGTKVNLMVRGKAMPAEVVKPTFIKQNYVKD